jgi:hypothetical protein
VRGTKNASAIAKSLAKTEAENRGALDALKEQAEEARELVEVAKAEEPFQDIHIPRPALIWSTNPISEREEIVFGTSWHQRLVRFSSYFCQPIIQHRVSQTTPYENVETDVRTDVEKVAKLRHGTTLSTFTTSEQEIYETWFGKYVVPVPKHSGTYVMSDELVSQLTSHASIGAHVPLDECYERLSRAAHNIVSVNVGRVHTNKIPVRDGSVIYSFALKLDSMHTLHTEGLFRYRPNQTNSSPTVTGLEKSTSHPFQLSSPQPKSAALPITILSEIGRRCWSLVGATLLGLFTLIRTSAILSQCVAACRNALPLILLNLIRRCSRNFPRLSAIIAAATSSH